MSRGGGKSQDYLTLAWFLLGCCERVLHFMGHEVTGTEMQNESFLSFFTYNNFGEPFGSQLEPFWLQLEILYLYFKLFACRGIMSV